MAIEAKNSAQGNSRAALDGRSTNLEKEVDALKYIISPTPPPAEGLTVNVKTDNALFGGSAALGNDSANDTAPIQNAIDYVYGQGGGTVYLPNGTYRVSGAYNLYSWAGVPYPCETSLSLLLKNGVTVQGESRVGTIIKEASGSNYHPIGGDHCANIGVKGLTVTSTTASGVDGAKFLDCSGVTIDDVLATGLYIGFALYSCSNSSILNSYADNCGMGICVGESDWTGYSGHSTNLAVTDCSASSCDVGFRVRSCMTVANSPGVRRSDYPYYSGSTTFLRCSVSGSSTCGFMMTDATGCVYQSCTSDTIGNGNDWYCNASVGNHYYACTGGATLKVEDGVTTNYGYMGASSGNTFSRT
jgi:polygalacturonase